MELSLREVLARAPAWPPSADRARISLDILTQLSRMPSSFASVLPLVAAELRNAVVSRAMHGIGENRTSDDAMPHGLVPLCYFEIAARLDEDLREQVQKAEADRNRLQKALNSAQALMDRRDHDIAELNREHTAVRAALKDAIAKHADYDQRLREAQHEISKGAEELEGLDERLQHAEELMRSKDERIKEVETQLHIEERKLLEQKEIYKENRSQSRFAAVVQREQLKRAQSSLLRAMHASLRAEGRGSLLLSLDALPLDEQLSKALMWADKLPEIKADETLLVPSPPKAATPMSTSPQLRTSQSAWETTSAASALTAAAASKRLASAWCK